MQKQPEPLNIGKIRWGKWLIAPAIIGAFIALLFLGVETTNDSSFCANCHEMKPYLKSWQAGKHKAVPCVDCHQEPGLLGGLRQRAEIMKHYSLLSIYFRRHRPTLVAQISTRACLDCHRKEIARTLTSRAGVLVSHKEMVDFDLSCERCHRAIGHFSKRAKIEQNVHAQCVICHRQNRISSSCGYCHVKDIGSKGPSQIDSYRKAELDLRKCEGCHAAVNCDSCHPEGTQLSEY